MAEQKGVIVSPNPIKVTEHLDIDGNVINPVTKEVIKEEEK
jgi:hypothetical protein